MVETQSDEILKDADKEDVSLLVVGDPFGWVRSSSQILPLLTDQEKGNDAHGHHPSRQSTQHPHPRSAQRVHNERRRRVRATTIQLWTDRIIGVLHRYMETR